MAVTTVGEYCPSPPAGPAGPRSRARRPRIGAGPVATLALHGLVAWLYVWFATAGTYSFGHRETDDYYDLLADAFLAGQLHLLIEPAPELLALPNPYDPARNARYRLRDASLYEGRYYLYWGPVPALVHATWKGVAGTSLGDGPACLAFGLAGCLLFWLLARTLRDQLAPGAPEVLVGLTYLCYALGGVSLYLQIRADVYKEAILAGTCFTLAGLLCWVRALGGSTPVGGWLASAGVLFGLGFGSRMTMIAYAVGAGLVLAWRARHAPRSPSDAAPLLRFGLPAAGALLALLLYNQVRFDHFAEFGTRYQLVSIASGQDRVPGGMHPAFVPLNLATYWAAVPEVLPWFPLLASTSPPLTLVDVVGFRWARDTLSIAAPLLAPLAVLAPLGVVLAVRRGRSGRSTRPIVAGLAIGLALDLLLLHLFIAATMRYLHDFLPVALLLGGLALWWLWPSRPRGEARREGPRGSHRGEARMEGPRGSHRQAWRAAYLALSGALLLVSLGMGFAYAFVHVGRVRPEPYLDLAYRLDGALAVPLRAVAPATWPDAYTAPASRRLLGAFPPEGAVLPLAGRPGVRLNELTAWSLLPAETTLTVSADGRTVFEGRLRPGRQRLSLARPLTVGPSGTVPLRLRFPDEPPRPAGSLWPVAVVGVE